ncbi:hypothetical protein AYO44_12185 [Planctomycetaceae bacterium SCGC AG-212-F19]|nr:hypothetical protein AYO44_12185 [Planctomycetaceae bacterium SCGC AG-212-F19]
MFSFIHAADLHLDSPLRGLDQYEGAPVKAIRIAARRALDNLVNLAIRQRVAFVLIAGDVYDGDWEDANTGFFFVQQMARLQTQGIRVFLISGNHDAANRLTRGLPYPNNVRVFSSDQPETVKIDDIRIAIHGQSYATQAETRNLAVGYPSPIPGHLNIGLLHTSLDGREGHESYAPCSLSDLVARDYDYWALGHIHQRESVNGERRPRVEFCGNIQGRHIRETGPKGCLLVQVDNARNLAVVFHPLDVFRWSLCQVDCAGAANQEDISQRAVQPIEEMMREADGRPLAVRVELVGSCPAHQKLLANTRTVVDDIRARALALDSEHLWIEKVGIKTVTPQSSEDDDPLAEDAISELLRVIGELRNNPGRLLEHLATGEFPSLRNRLPPEFTEGQTAPSFFQGEGGGEFLDRVQAFLVNAAIRKEIAQ